MFYQNHASHMPEGIKLENGVDFSFPTHLHRDFELIVVTDGQMSVFIDGNEYSLCEGEAVFVFPNQLHELKTQGKSCHFLCIFSQNVVHAYSKIVNNKIPVNNKFIPDFALIEALSSIKQNDSIIKAKGFLYLLCAQFDEKAEYREKKIIDDDLLSKIFRFVEDNYNGDCSLEALSKYTSYHYVYLSKFFKKSIGISFTDYVNRYRVSNACYLLLNTPQTILQTAYDCGFDSLRTFNRNFKNIMGIAPSVYQTNYVK